MRGPQLIVLTSLVASYAAAAAHYPLVDMTENSLQKKRDAHVNGTAPSYSAASPAAHGTSSGLNPSVTALPSAYNGSTWAVQATDISCVAQPSAPLYPPAVAVVSSSPLPLTGSSYVSSKSPSPGSVQTPVVVPAAKPSSSPSSASPLPVKQTPVSSPAIGTPSSPVGTSVGQSPAPLKPTLDSGKPAPSSPVWTGGAQSPAPLKPTWGAANPAPSSPVWTGSAQSPTWSAASSYPSSTTTSSVPAAPTYQQTSNAIVARFPALNTVASALLGFWLLHMLA